MKARLRLAIAALCCSCSLASGIEVEFTFDSSGNEALPAALVRGVSEAWDLNQKGIKALERSEFDAALAYFTEALAVFPGYTDAENNIGVVYFRKGTVSEARRAWEAVIKREPSYAIGWYNLGTLAYHERDYAKAAQCFETALKENRQFVEALLMLGKVSLSRGEKKAALDHFARAYKTDPKDADAWTHYAFTLIRNADTAAAEKILKEHLDDREALRMLGVVAAARRDYAKASDLYARSVGKGGSPQLQLELATIQHEAGRNQAALTTLKDYLGRMQNRSVADAWLLAGIVAQELGDISGSRGYFEKGNRYYPDDAIIKYNLAQVSYHLKDYAAAEKLWQTLADSLQDPLVYHLRALSAMRSGDLAAAEALIRKAIDLDQKAEYHDLLGLILYRRGQRDAAAQAFRKALALDPELRSAQLNLALLDKSDKSLAEAAVTAQKELAACRDSCADPAFVLSVIYYHQKEYARAVKTLLAVPEAGRDERILRHLAIYYRQMQETDKAIAVLEAAGARLVLELKTQQELVDLYLLAGRYGKAADRLLDMQGSWQGNPWRLYYQLGYAYMEQNDLSKARQYFEASLKAKPDNVAARGLLAFVANREGNSGLARSLWEQNLKDDPTNVALLVNLGLSQEDAGNYAAALESYRKAVVLKGQDKSLQINVGNAYTGMGQYTDALHAYGLALDSPKRQEAAYSAFLAAQKAGNRPKAEEMAGILKREFGSSDYAARVSAEQALRSGDTTRAVSLLEGIRQKDVGDNLTLATVYADRGAVAKAQEAMGRVPADAQYRKARSETEARIAYARGDCEAAMRILQGLRDTSFAFQYNMAVAAYACLRFSEVLEIGQRIAPRASGKDRADLCRVVGNAAFKLKDWKKAKAWYQQLSNVESRDPIVQYNLAVACYNLGDVKDSWHYYQGARELDPKIRNEDIEKRYQAGGKQTGDTPQVVMDTLDVLYNQAVGLQEKDSAAQAEALYRRIVARDTMYALAWNNLGAICAARGDFDTAEVYYQRSIAKRHDIPEAYANLVALYVALRNWPQAKRWVIKGRGHNPESELLAAVENMVQDSMDLEVKTVPKGGKK